MITKSILSLYFTFFCLIFFGFAQTQRLVLIEEATNASCGPCANQNPAFDALLNANRDKLTAIKYHWYFPGYDPMHNHNVTENNARVAYYGINGVPTATIDGVIEDGPGFSYPGGPHGYTQAIINEYYAVPSPFEMDMYHRLSDDNDSIYVILRIRAAEDVTGSFKAHIVVVEKHIHFNSPPGTNGETDFYDVMKKMLPDHNGTTIPSSWQTGDYMYIFQAWKLQNVYNLNELGVVGFIQNNISKSVKQACNSTEVMFIPYYDTDVALSGISNISETNCTGIITPKVVISNFGAVPLTSVDIICSVNGEGTQTFNWSGNLNFLQQEEVILPAISFAAASQYEAKVYLVNPNGGSDEFPKNDTITKSFEAAVVTPNEIKLMIKLDNNPEETTWQVENSSGEIIYSGGPYTQPGALIQQNLLFTQTDCYIFTIYDSGGNGLAVPGFFALFYSGNNQIVTGTNFGSMATAQFFADATVGMSEISDPSSVTVYPNPVSDHGFISLSLIRPAFVKIDLVDQFGKQISSYEQGLLDPGHHELKFSTEAMKQGIYMVKIYSGDQLFLRKITVLK